MFSESANAVWRERHDGDNPVGADVAVQAASRRPAFQRGARAMTRWEALPGGLRLLVSGEHTFGADALLLSDFAPVRPKDTACDLGSGCGVIPARWFALGRAPARVYALELRGEAVGLMRRTVAEGGFPPDRFLPVEGDLRRLDLPGGRFDLVTCNPPYTAAGHGRVSSGEAAETARHETACTLDDVCGAAAFLLRFGGRFCICHRPARLADAVSAMRAHGLEPKRMRFVHHSPLDGPWLFLLEGRRGGRPSLEVMPPLFTGNQQINEE